MSAGRQGGGVAVTAGVAVARLIGVKVGLFVLAALLG